MRCPRCRDEYVDGVAVCAHCGVDLIDDGTPLPPQVDALLGVFHPLAAERITGLLTHRRIAHDAMALPDPDLGGGHVEVLVDRDHRDDLRAELAVTYRELVGRLPEEQMHEVLAAGGTQPGWFDAPAGGWIDKEGRLQVDPGDAAEAEHDATRMAGPSLLILGGLLALFGWYSGGTGWVFLGLLLAAVGAFLPR